MEIMQILLSVNGVLILTGLVVSLVRRGQPDAEEHARELRAIRDAAERTERSVAAELSRQRIELNAALHALREESESRLERLSLRLGGSSVQPAAPPAVASHAAPVRDTLESRLTLLRERAESETAEA